MSNSEPIRVYVGADRSQALAIKVLEYSIKRNTTAKVDVIPMIDLSVPVPKDPRNGQRTGFSFSRFCIPALTNYQGKAIYMDADMLVFKDIRELWSLPFNGAKVLVPREVKHSNVTVAKENAPAARAKQCAVMLLDCSRLDWNIEFIVQGMDEGKYGYDQLMNELCILPEQEVGYEVPFEWNSLEYFDENTRLLHYTDMGTQPWVSTKNRNGSFWFEEVRRMLADGALTMETVEHEVKMGYFRPSILKEVRYGHLIPRIFRGLFDRKNEVADRLQGFVAHKAVYEEKRLRNRAVKDYERLTSGSLSSITK